MGIRPCALETVDVTRPRNPDPAFWQGKRVLLTGHTGFKGGVACNLVTPLGCGHDGHCAAARRRSQSIQFGWC